MKIHVITDPAGNIIAAGSEVVRPDGITAKIYPLHVNHSMHEIDAAEDIFQLDSVEFTNRLRQYLQKK
jgi:hypothetical protein